MGKESLPFDQCAMFRKVAKHDVQCSVRPFQGRCKEDPGAGRPATMLLSGRLADRLHKRGITFVGSELG